MLQQLDCCVVPGRSMIEPLEVCKWASHSTLSRTLPCHALFYIGKCPSPTLARNKTYVIWFIQHLFLIHNTSCWNLFNFFLNIYALMYLKFCFVSRRRQFIRSKNYTCISAKDDSWYNMSLFFFFFYARGFLSTLPELNLMPVLILFTHTNYNSLQLQTLFLGLDILLWISAGSHQNFCTNLLILLAMWQSIPFILSLSCPHSIFQNLWFRCQFSYHFLQCHWQTVPFFEFSLPDSSRSYYIKLFLIYLYFLHA